MVGTDYPRSLRPPADSFFLFGIRGVGKSTWARQQFPQAPRIDLLDEGVFQSYLRSPQRFGDELRRHKRGTWVVVDEVQRLPALLNEVHRAIEDLGLRFVLLGSSARKLKMAGTNLLAGRAVRREMHPLQPDEMGADFDLRGGPALRQRADHLARAAQARSTRRLRPAVPARGDPGRGPGPQPAGLRAIPADRRAVPRTSRQHRGPRARRRRGPDDGGRVPGDPAGHLSRDAAARATRRSCA